MKRSVFLILAALAIIISGCVPAGQKEGGAFLTVQDSAGQTVRLDKKPSRVVLLTPSLAEIYHAVGGDFIAMAGTPGTALPDYAKGKQSVGWSYQVDMEALVSLKPDLVVGLNGLNNYLSQGLAQNHVPFLLLSLSTYNDVKRAVRIFSAAAENTEAGKSIIEDLDRRMKQYIDRVQKKPYSFAVIHGTGKSLTIETKGSIACDAAERLGMVNVFDGLSMKDIGHMPPFSMEQLAVKDPDIIFLTTMVRPGQEAEVFTASVMAQPAWNELRAVKNNRVYFLPQDRFLKSPGVHYPEAVQFMADKVYGRGDA
ncbi:MAG: ABC transporter substrate-binding protein [Dialister sp.]|nr:ABC transporter substrate-binding protein [Dialister sp.]